MQQRGSIFTRISPCEAQPMQQCDHARWRERRSEAILGRATRPENEPTRGEAVVEARPHPVISPRRFFIAGATITTTIIAVITMNARLIGRVTNTVASPFAISMA